MLSNIYDKWDCSNYLSPTKQVKSVIVRLQVDVEPPARRGGGAYDRL